MIRCPKCNHELIDGAVFCDECGAPIGEKFVKEPPTTTYSEPKWEQPQATFTAEPIAENTPVSDAAKSSAAPEALNTAKEALGSALASAKEIVSKVPKKFLLFGAIGVAAVVVLIIIIALAAGGGGKKSNNNYAMYIKDGEIYYNSLNKNSESVQVTSRLAGSSDLDSYYLYSMNDQLGYYITMSKDGKYIFFPDRFDEYDEGINLYYKKASDANSEAIKIDSDVQYYCLNAASTAVTYLKGDDDATLYRYTLADDSKEKIASEVVGFMPSDDGNTIIFENEDNSIYIYANDEKEKVVSDITELQYITKDLGSVYYTKEGSLYKQVIGGDKVKIASDVYDVLKIYDSGEVYYLTYEENEVALKNYVNDDMQSIDAAITEPVPPTEPNVEHPGSEPQQWRYDDDEIAEYNADLAVYRAKKQKYDAAWEEYRNLEAEYYTKYEEYSSKASRDSLRESLEERTISYSSYVLHYYNGESEVEVTDAFNSNYYSFASDAAVIAYDAYAKSDFKKVNLSEITSAYDLEYAVKASFTADIEKYIAVKSTASLIEENEDVTTISISPNGTVIYYIDDIVDTKNYGELYCMTVTDGVLSKPQVYDSEVYAYHGYFASNDDFIYFKDYKNGEGELYVNGTKIDYDVHYYNADLYSELGKIFYYTDWDDEDNCGTLMVYDGKESVKVSDGVYTYSALSDGRVLYLYDYSTKYYKGDLYEWSNGNATKLDDDVISIIPVYDSNIRDLLYSYTY